MRLRRSVALPKADQLVLAAMFSTADTMKGLFLCMQNAARAVFRSGGVWKTRRLCKRRARRSQAVKGLLAAAAELTVKEPPAFSTASTADLDAPVT